MAKRKRKRDSSGSSHRPRVNDKRSNPRRPIWRIAIGGMVIVIVAAWVVWLSLKPSITTDQTATDQATPPATGLSQIVTLKHQEQTDQLQRVLDPAQGGWDTERLNDAAMAQLRQLARRIAQPGAVTSDSLATILSDDFRCEPLRPATVEISSGHRVQVQRSDPNADRQAAELTGVDGLTQALGQLTRQLGEDEAQRHAHLKIFRVDQRTSDVETIVKLEAAGGSPTERKQITSKWACTWNEAAASSPRLATIRVLEYEEVTLDDAKQGWLTDCTAAVLSGEASYRDELLHGMDHWVNRLDRRLMISRFGHHGVAIADVNGDGRDDIYLCQAGGLPNRLYVQQDDGTARDVSSKSKADYLDATTSALFADLDNDGDQDLILATIFALVISSNNGQGVFQPRVAVTEGNRTFSLSVADYDRDGRLDIFACRYRPDSRHDFELPLPVPYHDANNGGQNMLLRNQGNWQFQDVTQEVGLSENNTRFSFAAAWEDYDNDGDQDLYVANDYGRNCLYRNDDGRFADVASTANVEDIASGMSVTWGDYNHDGRMDVYVSNMFSSAGNRISFQTNFAADHQDESRTQLQRHARGNTLFENQASSADEAQTEQFKDVSLQQRVTLGRWAWASLFADINNDTWDDLLVVNGLMTTEDPGDL